MRVLGRDEADAQLLSKFWRFARVQGRRSRRSTPTRLEDVEAQAYALLLAERAGVRCRRWSSPAAAGPGTALIACPPAPRRDALATSMPATVTDALLDRPVAAGCARLHAARVAHGG